MKLLQKIGMFTILFCGFQTVDLHGAVQEYTSPKINEWPTNKADQIEWIIHNYPNYEEAFNILSQGTPDHFNHPTLNFYLLQNLPEHTDDDEFFDFGIFMITIEDYIKKNMKKNFLQRLHSIVERYDDENALTHNLTIQYVMNKINDPIWVKDIHQGIIETQLLLRAVNNNNIPLATFLLSIYNAYHEQYPKNDTGLNNKYDIGQTLLCIATNNNFIEIVNLLLTAGADVNIKGEDALTALMIASENEFIEIVQLLLTAKADTNIQGKYGLTALMIACKKNFIEIAKLLLTAKNIDVNIRTTDRKTLLMLMCKNNNTNIVELLLKKQADVNLQDAKNDTALIFACQEGYIEIVKLLLAANANVDLQGYEYNTPLIDACANGFIEIVQLLLHHNANTDLQYDDGNTALHYACKNGFPVIVELLLNHGANMNLNNSEEDKAEYYAETPEMQALFEQAKINRQAKNDQGSKKRKLVDNHESDDSSNAQPSNKKH